MKILHFPGFSLAGSASLPGGYKAYAIHSSSELDVCRVGNDVLGVGQMVPWSDPVTAVRGYRTGELALGDGAENQTPEPIGQDLTLIAYEKGDDLVAPGPRAPKLVEGFVLAANLGADAAHANCILRLPFAGRKQAAFFVRRSAYSIDPIDPALNIVVRGVRYLTRELIKQLADNANGTAPFIDEITDTWNPVLSTVNQQAGVSELVGLATYIGGGGYQEHYDELELWVYGNADAHDIIALGEASGERNA